MERASPSVSAGIPEVVPPSLGISLRSRWGILLVVLLALFAPPVALGYPSNGIALLSGVAVSSDVADAADIDIPTGRYSLWATVSGTGSCSPVIAVLTQSDNGNYAVSTAVNPYSLYGTVSGTTEGELWGNARVSILSTTGCTGETVDAWVIPNDSERTLNHTDYLVGIVLFLCVANVVYATFAGRN